MLKGLMSVIILLQMNRIFFLQSNLKIDKQNEWLSYINKISDSVRTFAQSDAAKMNEHHIRCTIRIVYIHTGWMPTDRIRNAKLITSS